MDYNKNIYKAYVIIFFHNLIPAYVIERLFWEQRGMTVLMVVLCEVIYAATIVMAEIPSGILADKVGRRPMLIIAAALAMLEFVILLFSYSFFGFAVVAVLAGISGACTSGAFNALIYDSLIECKNRNLYEKVLGRINALDFSAALIAALSGSLAARYYDFELNYMLSALSMFIALAFTVSLKEPPRDMAAESKEDFKAYFRDAFSFYKSNPRLALKVVNAMAIGACISYADEFWQLYIRDAGIPIIYFGVFSALIMLSRIPGNLISARLIGNFKEEHIIAFILGTTSLGLIASGIFPGIIGIAAIYFVFLASGVVEPLISGYIHHRAASDIRATVDSFQSLGKRAIVLVVGLGFGYVATIADVAVGFLFLGAACLLFLMIFLKNTKRFL